MRRVLSDEEWSLIKPHAPASGPAGGDRRLFVEACLYVLREGCSWRALPPGYGKWNSVWRRFRRWAESGAWAGVVDALRAGDDSTRMLDSTVVRTHPHAAGARKKAARRPSAAAAGGSGRRSTPRSTRPATRSCGSSPRASAATRRSPRRCWPGGGRRSSSATAATTATPTSGWCGDCGRGTSCRPWGAGRASTGTAAGCTGPGTGSSGWARAKRFRRAATRYDKLDTSYLAFVHLASLTIVLKDVFTVHTA